MSLKELRGSHNAKAQKAKKLTDDLDAYIRVVKNYTG